MSIAGFSSATNFARSNLTFSGSKKEPTELPLTTEALQAKTNTIKKALDEQPGHIIKIPTENGKAVYVSRRRAEAAYHTGQANLLTREDQELTEALHRYSTSKRTWLA